VIECRHPRCSECSHPIATTEVEPGHRWTRHTCTFCRAALQVRSTPDGYAIRSAAEAMRLQTAPLPAVASPALRGRFLDACRSVAAILRPCDPVEPGMAALTEDARNG